MEIGQTGHQALVTTVDLQQTAVVPKYLREIAQTLHLVELGHSALEITQRQYHVFVSSVRIIISNILSIL